jgi:predicted nucleic acid-binding protein
MVFVILIDANIFMYAAGRESPPSRDGSRHAGGALTA